MSLPIARNSGSGDRGAGGSGSSTPLQICRIRPSATPICCSASAVDVDTVRNRFLRCTQGMTTRSMFRPMVETGGRNLIDHRSVCTWFTRQSTGRLHHSGDRYGIPLQTSTIRSEFLKLRR